MLLLYISCLSINIFVVDRLQVEYAMQRNSCKPCFLINHVQLKIFSQLLKNRFSCYSFFGITQLGCFQKFLAIRKCFMLTAQYSSLLQTCKYLIIIFLLEILERMSKPCKETVYYLKMCLSESKFTSHNRYISVLDIFKLDFTEC